MDPTGKQVWMTSCGIKLGFVWRFLPHVQRSRVHILVFLSLRPKTGVLASCPDLELIESCVSRAAFVESVPGTK